MYNFSVMPLDENNIDERCRDICEQYLSGITNGILFIMTLVPEGNPPVDKVGRLCGIYKQYQERLKAFGVPCGVLLQATIGHGWKLGEMFPFQPLVGIMDGKTYEVVCPFDEDFHKHIEEVTRTIALCGVDHFMLDDDVSLMARPGSGCACPLHMARFNELAGTLYTKEQLLEELSKDTPEAERFNEIFIQTQGEALVAVTKAIRAGIDSVDPKIPGSFCANGSNAEFGGELAEIMAGKGNPVTMRVNNSFYSQIGPKYLSRSFYCAATEMAKTSDKVEIYLAETDTCPQNRYSTSAMSLHTHFTGSIIEGISGAAHWITRVNAYEPESGKAYRKVLSKYNGFYQTLSDLCKDVRWCGFRIPVMDKPYFRFRKENPVLREHYNAWGRCVFERMGLPMFFSKEKSGIACLEGEVRLCDSKIKDILSGYAVIDSAAAQHLAERGFGEYLGIEVKEWKGKSATGEEYVGNGKNSRMSCQVRPKELCIKDPAAKVDSYITNTKDKINFEKLFPGSVVYKNSLGGTVVTFAGTPEAIHNLTEAYSFLCQTRKTQFINLFADSGEFPAYLPGDEETYFRAGYLPNGELLCAVFNVGYDPIEKIEIVVEKPVSEMQILKSDGTKQKVDFEVAGGKYIIDAPAYTMNPVILIIIQ